MKVTAFKCDSCKRIMEPESVVSVVKILPSLFGGDLLTKVYSSNLDPDKSNIHYCMDCYNLYVTKPVDLFRIKDKQKKDAVLKEYKDSFIDNVVKNSTLKEPLSLAKSFSK